MSYGDITLRITSRLINKSGRWIFQSANPKERERWKEVSAVLPTMFRSLRSPSWNAPPSFTGTDFPSSSVTLPTRGNRRTSVASNSLLPFLSSVLVLLPAMWFVSFAPNHFPQFHRLHRLDKKSNFFIFCYVWFDSFVFSGSCCISN